MDHVFPNVLGPRCFLWERWKQQKSPCKTVEISGAENVGGQESQAPEEDEEFLGWLGWLGWLIEFHLDILDPTPLDITPG